MAYLHLAILAYWFVNTIRYQLKQQKIYHNWQEIVRVTNTQKVNKHVVKTKIMKSYK